MTVLQDKFGYFSTTNSETNRLRGWLSVSVVCQDWPSSLAEWIRNSDEQLMSRSTAILQIFQEDLLPAQGWDIFLTYLNSLKRSKSFLTLTCLVISLLHFHLHNTSTKIFFIFFLCIAFNPPRFFKCSQYLLGFFLKEFFVQIA